MLSCKRPTSTDPRPGADGLCLRDVSTNGVGLRRRGAALQKARDVATARAPTVRPVWSCESPWTTVTSSESSRMLPQVEKEVDTEPLGLRFRPSAIQMGELVVQPHPLSACLRAPWSSFRSECGLRLVRLKRQDPSAGAVREVKDSIPWLSARARRRAQL